MRVINRSENKFKRSCKQIQLLSRFAHESRFRKEHGYPCRRLYCVMDGNKRIEGTLIAFEAITRYRGNHSTHSGRLGGGPTMALLGQFMPSHFCMEDTLRTFRDSNFSELNLILDARFPNIFEQTNLTLINILISCKTNMYIVEYHFSEVTVLPEARLRQFTTKLKVISLNTPFNSDETK